MTQSRYEVPADAPAHVRNWLKHCRSRGQLWALVVLSLLAALASAYAERGKVTALVSVVFLLAALGPFLAVRWGERHGFFASAPSKELTGSRGEPTPGTADRRD